MLLFLGIVFPILTSGVFDAGGILHESTEPCHLNGRRNNAISPTTLSIAERQMPMDRYDPLVTSRSEKKHYFPNYGYEPYWADGEFMIKHPDYDLKPGQVATRMPLVCGEECGYIYLRVRHLCAARSDIYWLPYCYPCYYGEGISDLTSMYRTFNSYCELMNVNCRLPEVDKWGIIYMGRCRKPLSEDFIPLYPNKDILARVPGYVTGYEERLKKAEADLKDKLKQ